MQKSVAYWAEEALGCPYESPSLAPLRWRHKAGLIGAALAACATAALLTSSFLWIYQRSQNEKPVAVKLKLLEHMPAQAMAAVAIPAHLVPRTPAAPAVSIQAAPRTVPVAPTRPYLPQRAPITSVKPVPAQSQPTSAIKPVPAKSVPAKPATPATSSKKAAPAPTMPAPIAVAAKPMPQSVKRLASTKPDAERTASAATPVSAPASKGPVAKPIDVAPPAKFMIGELRADRVVLLNGAQVKAGGAFPNGEQVQSIDLSRGMIETDRRIIVLAP